ncbi:MAG TPA: S-layer homology domain-containing protein, partial [Acidimicrobiales bacterium]|nr:S-layer homology domain-containing protein [Acidimicrobiales bacterium]
EVRKFANGALARTEFSSATGGWSAGGTFPVVEDAGDAVLSNPNHSWKTTLTRERIETKYPSIGTLTDIQILDRNGIGDMGGRVLELRVVGTDGDVERTGNQFRSDFVLKSDWFAITVPPPPPVTARPITTACPEGEVPRDVFDDVDPDSVHALAVDCVAWREIAEGTSATTFSPNTSVTRGQMASFVARFVIAAGGSLPEDPADAFDDDEGSVHEDAINQLAAVGIVRGTGVRTYEPSTRIDRGQMASLIARALDHLDVPLEESPPSPFRDDNDSVHELAIDQLAAEGVVTGTAPGTYSPKDTARRDQMASTLARALDLALS